MKPFTLLLLLVSCTTVNAQLDPTFGNNGIVITDIAVSNDQAHAVTTDSEGRILAAGTSDVNGSIGFCVMRYLSSGQPDDSFGNQGFAVFTPGSTASLAFDIVTDNQNRILICGMINGQFGAMRLLDDGSPDLTFGEEGVLILDLPGFFDRAEAIDMTADGKILLGGYSGDIGTNDFAVVRLLDNGTPDTDFDDDGIAIIPILDENDEARGMAVQDDGKIVLAGSSYNGLQTDIAVVRLNEDGSLDETFSGDGKMTFDLGSSYDSIHDLLIQPDGKIVLVGDSWMWPNFAMLVARLNADGNFDIGFGNAGVSLTSFSQFTSPAHSVELQSDGKILAAGFVMLSTEYDFALIRLNADGSADTSFGDEGKVITHPGDSYDQINGSVIQSDGKLVVAGSQLESKSSYNFCLARYDTNVVSTNDVANDSSFRIFPNPASQLINFSIPAGVEVYGVRFTDSCGKTIHEEKGRSVSSRIMLPSNLPSGHYIIFLNTSVGNLTSSCLIQSH